MIDEGHKGRVNRIYTRDVCHPVLFPSQSAFGHQTRPRELQRQGHHYSTNYCRKKRERGFHLG